MIDGFVSAIILAGGMGQRMNSEIKKQMITIEGHSVLWHAVSAFEKVSSVGEIIVVSHSDDAELVKSQLSSINKPIKVILGGKSRAESARNGFNAVSDFARFVAIHDAARCLVTPKEIESVIEVAVKHGAASAVMSVSDTVKQVDEHGRIKATIPRENLRRAATPQIFLRDLYKLALDNSDASDTSITDDNILLERIGVDVYTVDTGCDNIKITTVEDLEIAASILKKRRCDVNV